MSAGRGAHVELAPARVGIGGVRALRGHHKLARMGRRPVAVRPDRRRVGGRRGWSHL
jgi:hypothetical protein